MVRRLRCTSCNSIHTELPDFLIPRKHYTADVIESQLDKRREDCPADDSTIYRWHWYYQLFLPQVEAMLQKIWCDVNQLHFPLLSSYSLLEKHRRFGSGWLTTVTQMIVNANLWQPTRFACCP
jgi:hypothetical protein